MKRLQAALDSGAFSMYNHYFAPSRKGLESDKDKASYDYMHTKAFKEYRDKYIEHLHEYGHIYDFYVGLDIIYNHEGTMEVQDYLESCGLFPLPVFHYGEPFEVLEDYIDRYEYIGVGGLGQGKSVQAYVAFGDEIFKRVIGSDGRPRVKVHGFAMTSVELMKRYPWYSCDSSTWGSLSRNGWARFPRISKDGGYDFLRKPAAWRFTDRSAHAALHIDKQSGMAKAAMGRYLKDTLDMCIDDLRGYYGRDVCNAAHTFLTAAALKEMYEVRWGFGEGANLYLAGNTGDAMTLRHIKREFQRVAKALPTGMNVRYLSSFYYPEVANKILAAMQPSERRILKCS